MMERWKTPVITEILALRPADLAARWRCSERHVRGLVRRGDLRSFRVGGKLIRIPIDAVEEFEKCYLNSGSCDTRTTEKTYARLSPDFLRDAAEALEIGTVRDAKEGKVV